MAAASLRNVEIAAAAAEVANDVDDMNNSSRHTSCSGYSNQHTYHQQEHEQPKKRNIYHQTANCHCHTGASILFWLAVILVLGELKTGKFIFLVIFFVFFLHFAERKEVFHANIFFVLCPAMMPSRAKKIFSACIKQ